MKEFLIKIVKGVVIGASMLIPGVSGGTMAIILNVYDELIRSVSGFRKDIKNNGLFLIQFALGGGLGILILAKPMLLAVTAYHLPMMYLFIGAILASVQPLYRKATIDKVKPINIVAAVIGVGVSPIVTIFLQNFLTIKEGTAKDNLLVLAIAGFLVAVALILPGISGSYVLLMMGLYETTLSAVTHFDLGYLLPMAGGAFAGMVLTTRILERAMERHPQFTYMLIIGFILGTLIEVFPGLPAGLEIPICIGTLALGFFVVLRITRMR